MTNIYHADNQILLVLLALLSASLLCLVIWSLWAHKKYKKCTEQINAQGRICLPVNEVSSILTHELTQPLASALISSQAAIKEAKLISPDTSKIIDNLDRSVMALRKTNDILGRFREFIQQGAFRPQIEQLDCNQLIDEVLDIIYPLAQEKSVTILYKKNPSNIRLKGDRIQLSQVLVNLLMNAIEAASLANSDKAEVTIRANSSDTGLEIIITDTGPGFDPAIIKSVGQPFATNKHQGLGLGIPIAKQIISKHQGELSWSNHVDGGACLRIFLPHSF